jgi:hypothetical protein
MLAYLEMQSYVKDLRRYRPPIRIKTMLSAVKRAPGDEVLKAKKTGLLKAWFRYSLWYVRLRRASKG